MKNKGISGIAGVSDSRTAFIISRIMKRNPGRLLILTATGGRGEKLAEDLSFFSDRTIRVIPEQETLLMNFEAKDNTPMMRRLAAISALRTDPEAVVIAPVSAAMKKLMPHQEYGRRNIRLRYGETIDPEGLKEQLVTLGYERMPMVESRGEFSQRGGIFDVFTPDAEEPYRIELFDTDIDSIRTFDLDTQRSTGRRDEIEIGPAQQMIADRDAFRNAAENIRKAYGRQIDHLEKQGPEYGAAVENLRKTESRLVEYITEISNIQLLDQYVHYFYDDLEFLWDYLDDGTLVVVDPDRAVEVLDARTKEMTQDLEGMLEQGKIVPGDFDILAKRKDFVRVYDHRPVYVITPFPKKVVGVSRFTEAHDYHSRQAPAYNGKMDLLESDLRSYLKKDYQITIACGSPGRLDGMKSFLDGLGLTDQIRLREGVLSSGMDFPDERILMLSESDIFGRQKERAGKRKKRRKISANSELLQSYTDLKVGDFVVHENHGIGKFLGIEPLEVQGETKDYLKIHYAGNDLLYVPVSQFDIVQKYIGAEGKTPKMNRLSGSEWKMTKARARAAIAEITDGLVKLYAERSAEKGYAFGPDTVWQREFEENFPFQETDDQLRAAEEIKADMEKPQPMDRLLCGDVGVGKTEVAARALFKCLGEGKQAAVLVPTTLLANQHYYTLKDRFEHFPFRIEMLSRFRDDREQRQILDELAAGKIDLIIGTHRLLSKDVRFKDLGLLVVDEEQRFGVEHKEAIKKMKAGVDVLTLTATPIPRTLNMSLSGIRDMSTIEEPPEERYPIQTYVMEQDDDVIREAIAREIERGGQVFVVYNRVKGIAHIAEHIRALVPDARVAVGHGRMSEQALEDVMLDFVNGNYDVLIATTIIESGIDIPNANTLIILDADRYGLAQMYQIRGRVGRSNRIAYAYLMYQRDKVLTETAEKRLRAIREFTEFGSGFKVAMRDLQIRGAGNLLGSEQSGHMAAVGYELYCKLINDEVRRLKGEAISENPEEVSVELAVSTNIPNWYIEDDAVKIQVYKRISSVVTPEDEDGVIEELIDRFGDIPKETLNLIRMSRIRSLARDLGISRISEQRRHIVFQFEKGAVFQPYGIVCLNEEFGSRAFIHGGVEPFIRIPLDPGRELEDVTDALEALSKKEGEKNAV